MGILVVATALATYLIPGCVGRGVRLGSESSCGGVWKSGDLEIWEPGNLEIWTSGTWKCWTQNIQKMKILKIKIRVAQNVCKVWISRKRSSRPHLIPFQVNFCVGRKSRKHAMVFVYFCNVPALGPLLLSILGGDVCSGI